MLWLQNWGCFKFKTERLDLKTLLWLQNWACFNVKAEAWNSLEQFFRKLFHLKTLLWLQNWACFKVKTTLLGTVGTVFSETVPASMF